MNIPIAHSTESVGRFLELIETTSPPQEVTIAYLKDAGFVSGHDRELIHIFRLLGFLHENAAPTELWVLYQVNGEEVLRDAIHQAYAGLFELYPENPQNLPDTALRMWFKPPQTGDSESSVVRAIRTFRRLCQIAGMVSAPIEKTDSSLATAAAKTEAPILLETPSEVANAPVRPELHLPARETHEQYIMMFTAMKEVFYE